MFDEVLVFVEHVMSGLYVTEGGQGVMVCGSLEDLDKSAGIWKGLDNMIHVSTVMTMSSQAATWSCPA